MSTREALSAKTDSISIRQRNQVLHAVALTRDALHAARAMALPVVDLVTRLWLAQALLRSGLVKLLDWDRALFLATYEYPVTWLAPNLAAIVGAATEVGGGLLLALGLGTRMAAFPLLALSLVIHFEYLAVERNLLWALLFGWFVVQGAGAISIDRLIGRGLAETPLPLAGSIRATCRSLTSLSARWYPLVLRLAMAVLLVSTHDTSTVIVATSLLLIFGVGTRLLAGSAAICILAGFLPGPDAGYWFFLYALLTLHGPGPFSIDHVFRSVFERYFPSANTQKQPDSTLPHVVVVGAGFGGLKAVRGLRHAACRITLVDQHNYHLFQPLLYQVATASLSPADIASPIRGLVRDQHNVQVLMAKVTGIDTQKRQVKLGDEHLDYDTLVLATGARHSYFGRDEWQTHAPGLKRIEDATAIRRKLLLAFEKAENARDAQEKLAFMNFVIVGAGPTGVELAGAIAELARWGMQDEFRTINPASARIILVQSGPRVLPSFPESLSAQAQSYLERLGVEVKIGERADNLDADGVRVGDEQIHARTIFWAAGVAASPAATWLQAEQDKAGRVVVGPDLSVLAHPDIFAIGDTAASMAWDGHPVPGLAPAAKQGGSYVARVIASRIEQRQPPAPFRYHHMGSLATIGRRAAVADFGRLRLSGSSAWWLWGAVHVLLLTGTRNRVSVILEWIWAYLSYRSSTRLITDTTS